MKRQPRYAQVRVSCLFRQPPANSEHRSEHKEITVILFYGSGCYRLGEEPRQAPPLAYETATRATYAAFSAYGKQSALRLKSVLLLDDIRDVAEKHLNVEAMELRVLLEGTSFLLRPAPAPQLTFNDFLAKLWNGKKHTGGSEY